MNRALLRAFLAIMLLTVAGQAVKLRGVEQRPVTRVDLYDSRLVPFLQETRRDSPVTYDSILLNLSRIRADDPHGQYRPEERVVAETLISRLTRTD